jgi:GNAT superfamily N-acetyltransferase
MEINFKIANKEDIPLLLDFMELFYAHEGYPLQRDKAEKVLQKLLTNHDLGYAWLINYQEKAVGYIYLTFGFSLEYHGRDAFIDEIFILENYRKLGIGKRAMEFIDEMCPEYGVNALHLEVERVNVNAKKLYEKSNFQDRERFLMVKKF